MSEFSRVEIIKELERKYNSYMTMNLLNYTPDVIQALLVTTMQQIGKLLENEKGK